MNESMSKYKPDWLEAKQRMADWWAGKKTGRVAASVRAPVKMDSAPDYIHKSPDKYIDAGAVFHNLERELNHTFWGGDAFPYHFIYFGPMYNPMTYFGATPIFTETTTWYAPCFKSLDEILAYEPDPDNNKWVQLEREITKMSIERSGGSYMVTVNGVSAIVDTLAGLLGNEALLMAMADEPEKVIAARDKLLRYFTPTYDASYGAASECNSGGSIDWLGVWTPGKALSNQSDLCVMISHAMFDKFIFDDMKSMFDHLDHGYYHLHEGEIMHLDSLLKIDKIEMIQWSPDTRVGIPDYDDPLKWTGLFKRIQNAGRRVLIDVPHERVKELLTKIDRDLTYLNVSCPDEQTACQVLRDL